MLQDPTTSDPASGPSKVLAFAYRFRLLIGIVSMGLLLLGPNTWPVVALGFLGVWVYILAVVFALVQARRAAKQSDEDH